MVESLSIGYKTVFFLFDKSTQVLTDVVSKPKRAPVIPRLFALNGHYTQNIRLHTSDYVPPGDSRSIRISPQKIDEHDF